MYDRQLGIFFGRY